MKHVVGIDLGTSNCAVASVALADGAEAPVQDFPVLQLVRPGELGARALLPSVLYLPFPGEFPPQALALPWEPAGAGPDPQPLASAPSVPPDGPGATPGRGSPPSQPVSLIVGECARWQAGRVPGRAITSAKSWLIHGAVDRQALILPWGAASDVPRLSPVAAQAALLRHMKAAWDAARPDAPLREQEVVLTIPASFDEAARALTLQAARDAGFPLEHLTLLEEPQAAFYDFTSRHRAALARALDGVRLVLIVDVGGGTTDFSLVQVAMLPEGPALQRIAIGEHLLLGGDNMDAAIARLVERKTSPDGRRLTAAQWAQALQAARAAKELMLGASPPASVPVSIAATGSRLVAGTLSTELTRDEVRDIAAAGFFPAVTAEALPTSPGRGIGVVELGLPFASDAGIPRHLVAFLTTHAQAGHRALGGSPASAGLPRPDALLLNGGVFNSPVLTEALVTAVSALWPTQPRIPLLPHDSLDRAVARGAAYSGLARRALGKKIGGGAPRAFYAVVSAEGGRKGVCLVPRGLEEGQTVTLADRTFGLTLGRPVQFQLASTTSDRLDRPGELVELEGDTFKPLPPIHTVLRGQQTGQVQVSLVATLSEVGTLALSCVAGAERWRLEFELRGTGGGSDGLASQPLTVTESMPARFTEASTEIDRVFGTKPLPVEPKDVKQLFRTLERILGPRETWRLPVLRELWTGLWAGVGKRRRTVDHERLMLQLLGFSLRPGIGYPLDAWRCEQTFGLFKESVTHHGEQPVWAEFWILWRRIAAGLTEAAQLQLFAFVEPHLRRRVPLGALPPKEKLRGVQPQALEEMVRCAASLELVDPHAKAELGGWIETRLRSKDTVGGPWAWALGRLGARVPVQGAAHRVVSIDLAETWIELLLQLSPARHDGALFAIAQLARRTGDRARDIDEALRRRVVEALEAAHVPRAWRAAVEDVVQLSRDDEARVLGDTLPVGLALE